MLDSKRKEDKTHRLNVKRDQGRKKDKRKRSRSDKRRNKSSSEESSRSESSRRKSRGREEKMQEEKKSVHSHSDHRQSEETDDGSYVDVPFEAFLLKKNFDYILVDKEDIEEYTGKKDTKINQILKVPYFGSLQLASHFISQMYRNSKFETKTEEEFILV